MLPSLQWSRLWPLCWLLPTRQTPTNRHCTHSDPRGLFWLRGWCTCWCDGVVRSCLNGYACACWYVHVYVCVQEWLQGPLQSEGIFLQGTDSIGRALAIIRVADHVSDKKTLKTMKLFVCYVMNAMVGPVVQGRESKHAFNQRSDNRLPEWPAGQRGLVQLGQQRVVVKFSGETGIDPVLESQTHIQSLFPYQEGAI